MHTLIIIPAARLAAANTAARLSKASGGLGNGQDAFVVGLSRDGKAPPTHYWCAGRFKGADAALNALKTTGAIVVEYDDTSEPTKTLTTLGLQPIYPPFTEA